MVVVVVVVVVVVDWRPPRLPLAESKPRAGCREAGLRRRRGRDEGVVEMAFVPRRERQPLRRVAAPGRRDLRGGRVERPELGLR